MKQEVKIGQQDYTVLILIRDSTTGAPKTALTFESAGIDVCYTRVETDNDVVLTAGAPVTTTLTGAHVDWGFVLVDDTNAPGLYELDIADGVFVAGAWSAVVSLICTGCDPVQIEFVLVPEAPYTGVSLANIFGTALTAQIAAAWVKFFDKASPTGTVNSLPDAVPGAVNALPINDGTTAYTSVGVLAKILKYLQLMVRKDAAIATDNATELTAINANGGSGAGAFSNQTDSEEALRDRGDAAWITATGFATPTNITAASGVALAASQHVIVDSGTVTTVPAVTLANGAHGGAGTTITLQTPIEANVASETNHDFTALQKTSLNASTPASVQNIPVDGTLQVNTVKLGGTTQTAKDVGALNVTGLNTLAGHDPGATLVKVADLPAAAPSAATVADAVWDEAIAGHAGAGSAGITLAGVSAPTAAAVADAVWDEAISGHLVAGSTGAKLNTASASAGSGAITWTYTLTNSQDGLPIADADVWVSTDLSGANVVASGTTNASGVVTFYLDAGTYYVFRQKSGWDFTNPDTEVVS